ncbi:YgjV family protein [Desulfovibrio aerotolerans]|uniref:YgjV family protein n=1 Tax=Solidesulfovibrio aerotolerans TaxID=295255 RepID=A0A7C9IJ02_9BACT|nr:YgjV family protein [Solidesulfovibrio aerotolerans]MYL81701.1 YgjV family protein [Solidesulfovibrio aerotolerans]
MDFFSPAQMVGYLAFVLGVTAFAQRIDWKLKSLIAVECLAYTVHFALLGNPTASFSAGLSAVRMFASLRTRSPYLAGFFLAANIILGVWLATSWTALFSIAAGCSGTVAAFFLTGIRLRGLLFFATLCWLGNNIASGSIGGTLLESIIAVVNGATMWRLWREGRTR